MYLSILGELQLIHTLLDGIERMVTAAIAAETALSPESLLEQQARQIRDQLQLLSNEISESINQQLP